jgi:hypothetical protein
VIDDGDAIGTSVHQIQPTVGIAGAFADEDTTGQQGAHSGFWLSPDGRHGDTAFIESQGQGAGTATDGGGFAGPAGTWTLEDTMLEGHAATPVVALWAPVGHYADMFIDCSVFTPYFVPLVPLQCFDPGP